jgi:hypothetical protein
MRIVLPIVVSALSLFSASCKEEEKPRENVVTKFEEKKEAATELENVKSKMTVKLSRASLKVDFPEIYMAQPPEPNDQLEYDMALYNGQKDFEVRYRIQMLEEDDIFDEEKVKELIVRATTALSGGKVVEPNMFPQAAVESEFGAEIGGAAFFELDSDFGGDYKYCQLVTHYKTGRAIVMIIMMGKDTEVFAGPGKRMFYSVKYYK